MLVKAMEEPPLGQARNIVSRSQSHEPASSAAAAAKDHPAATAQSEQEVEYFIPCVLPVSRRVWTSAHLRWACRKHRAFHNSRPWLKKLVALGPLGGIFSSLMGCAAARANLGRRKTSSPLHPHLHPWHAIYRRNQRVNSTAPNSTDRSWARNFNLSSFSRAPVGQHPSGPSHKMLAHQPPAVSSRESAKIMGR